MSLLLWGLVGLPAVAGAALVIWRQWLDRAAPTVALLTATAALLLAVVVAIARPTASAPFLPSAPLTLVTDGLAAVVAITVAAVGLLVLLAAAAEIDDARARFFGLMLLFLSAVLLTVTAANLVGLLLAWEMMGATSYALIAHHWRSDRHADSGAMAFLTTRAGDLGLYLAAGAALAAGAGLGLPNFGLDGLAGLPAPWLHVAAAGVLAAAFGKAAQLPFSFWLSRAMDGPSPVSALLHSAAMVAMGGYLLLRTAPLLGAAGWAAGVAAWGGALTALVLGAVAIAQSDLKQLLAASTSAQLGFVVLGAGTAAYGGVTAGTAHLVGHAAVKSLLFLAAGAWLATLGTQQLAALRGAARAHPVVGAGAVVGLLALAGVPPLSLWATKDAVLAAAGQRSFALYLVTLAAALLSAAYAAKALGLLLTDPVSEPKRGLSAARNPVSVPKRGRLPLALLAIGAAVLGVLALPWFGAALGELSPPISPQKLVLTGLLALAVTALVVAMPRLLPAPGWARNWLNLEAAAHAVAVRPVLALATALARFDDRVLHAAVLATAPAARRLAAGAATADDAGLHGGAVRRVTDGARRLGQLARRPQTGQLHHYYAQAAVVLAAAVVLLLVVS
ncbi:MAG: NADH-quinone oxidoreductase subunit L [Pseudonocardiaceae bacterium]|nr:NADH-quinone oxidoreductase subunit L [Pseudonocardiaceae bacterium]